MPIEDGAQAACTPSCLRARTRRGCNTETSQGTRAPGSASSHRSRRRKVRRPRPQHPHRASSASGGLVPPPRALPGFSSCVLFPIDLGSQIASTELLAPSPFASAKWGLKHPVPRVEGPDEAGPALAPSTLGTLASLGWPRPVLALLTPCVSFGRAAQAWASTCGFQDRSAGAPSPAEETISPWPRPLGCQFLLFHLSMLCLQPHQALQVVPASFAAITYGASLSVIRGALPCREFWVESSAIVEDSHRNLYIACGIRYKLLADCQSLSRLRFG